MEKPIIVSTMIRLRRIQKLGLFLPLVMTCLLACSGPESVDELKAAGQKAFLKQDYRKARGYFLEAVTQAPSDKELLFYTGLSYKRDYLYDSAMFYLKRLDILYPKDRETNLHLYEIALALEDWDYALAAMGGLIGTGDNIEEYYAKYAELWGRKDHPGNAYFYIKKAIEVEPDNPAHYLQAAHLATIVEPGPAALYWLDSAVARFGENTALMSARGMILAQMEDYEAAEVIYRDLLAKDTGNYSSRINLANALSSQGNAAKRREALELYRSVEDMAPPEFKIDSLIEELETELE